ncbi:MAG: hypothetical protein ACKO3R_01405, partial [bacterium]
LLNTASSLERILNLASSASSTQRMIRQSRNGLPVKGGPLSLLTSSINDHFGVIQAIKKRKAESRFCEKLTYEGFELFIFVENRKLVSLIIDPHQFLNVFDAKKIAQEMDKIDLGNLVIDWSSKDRRGKEYSWIVWSPKEKEERIQQLIESYKTNNLSLHLLFNTINELWESLSETNKEEFLLDLLPSLIILYNFSGFGVPATYLKALKPLSGKELYEKNRFCLKTGAYLNCGLFKDRNNYKDFNVGGLKCPLSRRLMIQPALKDSQGKGLNGDSINKAGFRLLKQKKDLILSDFVRKRCLPKYMERDQEAALGGYSPMNDEQVKKLFNLYNARGKLNTSILFQLCKERVVKFNVIKLSPRNNSNKLFLDLESNGSKPINFKLIGITINPSALQSFLLKNLYRPKIKKSNPVIQPANLLFQFEWYLENLYKYIFAINQELNKPEHTRSIKRFREKFYVFDDIATLYCQDSNEYRIVFSNYKRRLNSNNPHDFEPIFYDIGQNSDTGDGPTDYKVFLENDDLLNH